MDNKRQSVHLVAVEQQVHLHQVALLVVRQLVVQRSVTLGVCFQGIKEVIDDLVQRHLVVDLHQVGVQILHIHELSPAILAEGHDVAYELVGRDDGHVHKRLQRLGNAARVGVVVGVVHEDSGTVGLDDLIDDAGQGGDQIQVKFSLQTLLDDLHVEHPQEAHAEPEPQCHRGLRLKAQRGIVELELFQGVPQVGVFTAVLGVDAAVDHGLGRTIAGQRFCRRILYAGDCIAYAGVPDVLDGGGEVAHLTGTQLAAGVQTDGQHMAAFHHLVDCPAGHHLHVHTGLDTAFHDSHQNNDAAVGVILGVEDQRLQRSVFVPGGSGHVLDDVLQHCVDVDARLGGDLRRVHSRQTDDVLDLLLHPQGIGRGQVDLVQDR